MKRRIPLLLLFVPVVAVGDPPATEAPSPGAGAAPQSVPADMPACDTLPPDAEFRHYTGYGIAGSEVQALQAAREDAYALAERAVCTGQLGKRRCEEILGNLAQLDAQPQYIRKGYPRSERYRACFTLQIERKWVDLPYLQREFRRELGGLGMMLQSRYGRGSLRVEPPTWADSQCSVGGVGEVLLGELAGAFGPVGLRVDDSDPAGPSLRVMLARSGDRLDLLSTYVGADGVESRFPPVGFLPELYGLEGDHEPSCRWDRELGLTEGHRVGGDGRTARVVIPGNTGEYCEGDLMEPMVVVDRPSRVRLFSVERDGTAYVIWPYLPEMDDRVERTLSLGEAQVQRPKVGEERLIAVAIPEEQSFGDTASWRACKWPAPFDASAFPTGAAVGSVGFLVAPEGAEGCPMGVNLAPIPDLPVCGASR